MQVYFDNAASTPMRLEVLEAMLPYFSEQFGNPSSVHSHGRKLRAAVEAARKTVAEILGASPAEIVFTSGGTEADNFAISCGAKFGKVKTLITNPLEHHAVLYPMKRTAQALGAKLEMLSPDDKGNIDLGELESLLKTAYDQKGEGEYAALVAIMHANNEIGVLYPIEEIAALCREYKAIYHTDSVQTAGLYDLNAARIRAHFMAGSAHKFYGPKGVGFLYRDPEMLIEPLVWGGGQERNLRAGTENVASIVGMARALELARDEADKRRNHLQHLKDTFRQLLIEKVPGVSFNGETAPDRSLPTVLNVAFPIDDPESLLLFNFDIYQISASGGSACTSGSVHPSHVLAAIGCSPNRMANSIRFSFGCQNTVEEAEYVANVVEKIVTPNVVAALVS